MKVTRFEDLDCWKAARTLTKTIFLVSSTGKLSNDWDVRSQLRRAAVSTMNNIAEGFARYHQKDFVRFLEISQSSAAEVKSMLYLLEDVSYLDDQILQELHEKTDLLRKLTLGLIRYLNNNH
ncbi:MAG: four helix bundle protein [Saprospiraceae bacterium]|nr:four helix bundle protein [Saprospiraceae bacterium]